MVWRVFHSSIHMAREVPGRDAMCLTLCRKSVPDIPLMEKLMKNLFVITTIILFTVSACAKTNSINSKGLPNYEGLGEPTFSLPSLKNLF